MEQHTAHASKDEEQIPDTERNDGALDDTDLASVAGGLSSGDITLKRGGSTASVPMETLSLNYTKIKF